MRSNSDIKWLNLKLLQLTALLCVCVCVCVYLCEKLFGSLTGENYGRKRYVLCRLMWLLQVGGRTFLRCTYWRQVALATKFCKEALKIFLGPLYALLTQIYLVSDCFFSVHVK